MGRGFSIVLSAVALMTTLLAGSDKERVMTTPNRRLVIATVLVVLAALAGTAIAQEAGSIISRWVLDSGGGPVSGGEVVIDGSLGQPIVGLSHGLEMAMNAGYWTGYPLLQVSKSDGLEYWYAGWNYQYTIVVTNTGMVTIENLVVTDTLPAGVQVTLLPPGASQEAGGIIRWSSLGTLGAGQVLTLTLPVRTHTNLRGTITNVAVAACDGGISATAPDTTLILAAPTPVPSVTPSLTATPQPSATPTPTVTATATATVAPPWAIWLPAILR